MNKKIITSEELAKIVRGGFTDIDKRFDGVDKKIEKKIEELASMTKRGFDDILEKMATKEDIKHMEDKFERLEMLVMQDHRRRIERLEADVKYMKDLLAV